MAKDLFEFCSKLPKIELHAHLNGSISISTLKELIKKKEQDHLSLLSLDLDQIVSQADSLDTIFQLFGIIYRVVNDLDAVRYLTRTVIQEFASDNVRYLEIRTTLRSKQQSGFEKEEYLLNVLDEMKRAELEFSTIKVRLIASIDRRTTLEDALETVELAQKHREKGIVGLDLCGDPTKGDWLLLKPAFEKARSLGFKITLHVGEIENYPESTDMAFFSPDRIGHAIFLNEEATKFIASKKIPLELCLSSNVKGQAVKTHSDHHMKYWLDLHHPISICTDDKGIFSCTVSSEFEVAGKCFDLTLDDLFNISYRTIDFIFAGEDIKNHLRQIWAEEKALLLQAE